MPASNILMAIVGPTASGKTDLAVQLAQHYQTEILSFDSRQCYHELNIGVATPPASVLRAVPHHFIQSHSIHEPVDAAAYEVFALHVLEKLFSKHRVVIAVGGTGLYLKALTEGLDAIPPVPEDLRHQLRRHYEVKGMTWLQEELKQADPQWYAQGEIKNPHRMLRALEVVMHTGQSILHYQQQQRAERPFRVFKLGLSPERTMLYERINKRVDKMMDAGLLEEVHRLMPYQHLQALQTVGYTELIDYFSRASSLDKAIDDIRKHTRHYAKRQLTWFGKDDQIHWLNEPYLQQAIALADTFLQSA